MHRNDADGAVNDGQTTRVRVISRGRERALRLVGKPLAPKLT